MMNVFRAASQFGYSADQILKMAGGSMPGFESRIKHALAAGYSAEQILKFLQNAFQGKIPKKYAKEKWEPSAATMRMGPSEPGPTERKREKYKQRNLANLLDPGRLATQAAGATIGGALGGPLGAVAGAYAGGVANDEVLGAYAKYLETGGQLGLEDYLKAAMKGGIKGFAAYQAAKVAPEILAAIRGRRQEAPGPVMEDGEVIDITPEQIESQQLQIGTDQANAQPPPEGPQSPQPETPPSGQVPEVVEEGEIVLRPEAKQPPSIQADQARNILKSAGMLGSMDLLSKTMEPGDIAGAVRGMLGRGRTRQLEKMAGVSLEDLVEAAYRPSGQASNQAPMKQPVSQEVIQQEEVIQSVRPTEASQQLEPSPEKAPKQKSLVYDPTTPTEDITIEAVGRTIGQAMPNKPIGKPKQWDPIRALPSSNVRDVFYDPKQKYMQVLFSNGGIYEYFNVPKEDVQSVLDGEGVAKTIGQSPFRVYHPEKSEGSIGAAFNDLIKGKKYDYNKIDDPKIRDRGTRAIAKADRIIRATDTLDGFADIMEKAKAKQELKAPHVQQALQDAAVDLDDQQLEDMIYDIRMQMRKYADWTKKNPSKTSKPYSGWTPARMKTALKGELGESKREAGNQKKTATIRRERAKGPP